MVTPTELAQFTYLADRLRKRGRTPLNAARVVRDGSIALGLPREKATRLFSKYLASVQSA